MTRKVLILLAAVLGILMTALVIHRGHYWPAGAILLPLGLWLNLRREPAQRHVRPAIRILGWTFVAVALMAIIGSVLIIAAGK